MRTSTALLQMSLALLIAASGADKPAASEPVAEDGEGRRIAKDASLPRQSRGGDDSDASETHMLGGQAAAMGNHGKYFQDFYTLQYGPRQIEFGHVCENPSEWEQRFERKDLDKQHHQGQVQRYGHNPEKDHYEFGYRRGNEHHFQERHEKAAPKQGHATTKVRWGDKHGGYGEHYWDYNHGGHDEGDGGGEGSAPVPEIASSNSESDEHRMQFKRQSSSSPQSRESSDGEFTPSSRGSRKHHRHTPTTGSTRSESRESRTTSKPPMHPVFSKPGTTSTTTPAPTGFRPGTPFIGGFSPSPGRSPSPRGPKAASFFASDFTAGMFPGSFGPQAAASAPVPSGAVPAARRLILDPHTGMVRDEDTGRMYALQPVS